MSCPFKDNTLGSKNAIKNILDIITSKGCAEMGKVTQILMNEAMKIERTEYLKAQPYERNPNRTGQSNGFKKKTLMSRGGCINLQIPQVRDSGFYPKSLERGQRFEQALLSSIAEMYVKGVSTRRIGTILKKLCGDIEITSSTVSRITEKLDPALKEWRERPLGNFPYILFDAVFHKIRTDHVVLDQAVLIAYGVDEQGKREVLGVSVSVSEHETHWKNFFESLVSRGLHGVKYIVSDAHSGMKAARKAVFGSIPWQRCQFHLQQNASAYVSKKHRKEEVAKDIAEIFDAPNREEAERLLKLAVNKYERIEPKLSHWMETNLPEGFTAFSLPQKHQKKMRTSNLAERVNKEIRRRTKVVGIFPNDSSCLRLISAILCEIHEAWMVGNIYLNMSEDEECKKRE